MDDRDVLVMERYIFENFQEPTDDLYNSYCRWAADEILERMIEETERLPEHMCGIPRMTAEEIVEDFMFKMEYLAYNATCDSVRTLFNVARDEASLVLNYIYSSR